MPPKTASRRAAQPKRRTRAEILADTREKLVAAAAELVGKSGYADCSVSKITTRAGVAQGTFYTYFDSRQELFDQLLPELGERMYAFIGQRIKGAHSLIEVEERGFRAFLDFHEVVPGFHRILREAQTMAPKAFAKHTKNTTAHYVHSVRMSWERGELPGYGESELETLAVILMSFRSYYGSRFVSGKSGQVHDQAVETYMKFVRAGLAYREALGDVPASAGRAKTVAQSS